MALKQDGVHFALCPKPGNKIEGVVLKGVCILGIFCPQRGQAFKPAHLYVELSGRARNELVTHQLSYRSNLSQVFVMKIRLNYRNVSF